MRRLNAKFTSCKLSRVALLSAVDATAPLVVVGSYDERDNRLMLWRCAPDEESRVLCSLEHEGDVMDLAADPVFQHAVSASSTGQLTMYALQPDESLSAVGGWSGMRGVCCNAVALKDAAVIAAANAAGDVVCVDLTSQTALSRGADGCCVHALAWIDQHALASGSALGQLRLWDVRAGLGAPSRTLVLRGEPQALYCLARHPGQPHLVATGGAGGALCVWDLRQERFPVTLLESGAPDLWALAFHPAQPEHLFVGGDAGQLLRCSWDAVVGNDAGSSFAPDVSAADGDGRGLHHKLSLTALLPATQTLPVNSLAVANRLLVAGTEDEVLYVLGEPLA